MGGVCSFFGFELVSGYQYFDRYSQALKYLKGLGFQVVEYVTVDHETLLDDIYCFSDRVADLGYPVDGLVLAYNDLAYGHSLGETKHHPKGLIAFKWQDDEVETVLRDIEWSASRTGLFNPVAIFDPVELNGTTVSRASVHNLSILKNLELGIGDTITVYKANMIIPQISDNLTRSGNIKVLDTCPFCGSSLVIKNSEDTQVLVCENPDCEVKLIGKFVCMTDKKALDVKGLNQQYLNLFVKAGFLREYKDLFYLSEHKDELLEYDGLGEVLLNKLFARIEDSRRVDFIRFFCSLGIPGCGRHIGEILAHVSDSPERLLELGFDKLIKVKGIGPESAQSIVDHIHDHYTEIREYMRELTFLDEYIEDKGLANTKQLTFAISGKLYGFENRDALVLDIRAHGHKFTGSVSKNIDFLIANDIDAGSSKIKKAQDLGVSIISEQEYKDIVKE